MRTKIDKDEQYQVTVRRDLESGNAVIEQWKNEKGQAHRLDGPSEIERDPVTGVIVKECWQQNGRLERVDGPAVVRRNAKTGAVTFIAWYRNGIKIAPPKGSAPRIIRQNARSTPRPG